MAASTAASNRPRDTARNGSGASSSSNWELKGNPKSTSASSVGNSERVCFRCKEVGHYAKNCTKERKVVTCYLCKEEGHIASKRKQKQAPKRDQVTTVSDINAGMSGEKFIREVEISGNRLTH